MKLIDLNEDIDWREKTSLTDVLKRYPGKWLHFSQIDKIGVNPNKSHRDPHGVYFYSVDWWLTTDNKRLADGTMYGSDYRHYFICDIDRSGPGLDLRKVTISDIENLARRNGWIDLWNAEKDTVNYHRHTTKMPGSILWGFIECMQEEGKISWNAAFRGLDYIYDDAAIIHSNEPVQLLVMNPKKIRIIDKGKAPNISNNYSIEAWKKPALKFFGMIKSKYGGEVYWDQKQPWVKWKVGEFVFRLTMEASSALRFYFSHGRAVGSERLDRIDFEQMTFDQCMDHIDELTQDISARQTDIHFTPFMPIEEAKTFISNEIAGEKLNFKVVVENDYAGINKDSDFNSVRFESIQTKKYHKNIIEARYFADITEKKFSVSVYVRVNNRLVLGHQMIGKDGWSKEDNLKVLLEKLTKDVKHLEERFGPKNSYDFTSLPFIYREEDYKGFLGWLVSNCGVSLGGKFQKEFSDEVAFWKALPESKKREVLDEVSKKVRERVGKTKARKPVYGESVNALAPLNESLIAIPPKVKAECLDYVHFMILLWAQEKLRGKFKQFPEHVRALRAEIAKLGGKFPTAAERAVPKDVNVEIVKLDWTGMPANYLKLEPTLTNMVIAVDFRPDAWGKAMGCWKADKKAVITCPGNIDYFRNWPNTDPENLSFALAAMDECINHELRHMVQTVLLAAKDPRQVELHPDYAKQNNAGVRGSDYYTSPIEFDATIGSVAHDFMVHYKIVKQTGNVMSISKAIKKFVGAEPSSLFDNFTIDAFFKYWKAKDETKWRIAIRKFTQEVKRIVDNEINTDTK